ncbi:MAG: HupE/UreJ family protein [Arenibacterium sp.]
MLRPFIALMPRLALIALLSSLVLGTTPRVAVSHEIVPTIGDLEVREGQVVLTLRMNLEAFLAGIDLDTVIDTNTADEAERYDALRAMEPAQLQGEVAQWAPGWLATVGVKAGSPVTLSVENVSIPPAGDVELLRPSVLTVAGDLPSGARTLQVAWPEGSGGLVLRQQGVEAPFTGFVEGGAETEPFAISGGGMQTGIEAFVSYIPVGFDHILPKGLDHILFVLGLFFLSTRLGPLLWQVSAFTLAHTITLAMGALGWVNIPGSIVEPLIAASITYVAVENIFTQSLNRWRPLVIFGFGLLHGLGFASVLGEFGLPDGQFIPALIGFNIGVELGQLTVIAIAFLAVGLWFRRKDFYRPFIAVPASCVIAVVGAYWFVERVFL